LKEEYPWVVHCKWCDKTIVRGTKRVVENNEYFCNISCYWNYKDEEG